MSKYLTAKNIAIVVGLLVLIFGSRILFPVALPTIQLPAEKIPGLPITNTLLATILADITVLAFGFLATRKMELVPRGLQNVFEWVIEAFYGLAKDVAGPNADKFFPLFMSILLFLVVANWYELVPGFDSIGIIEEPHGENVTAYRVHDLGPIAILTGERVEHGEHSDGEGYVLVPFLRVPTSDLNLPLGLALVSWVYSQVMGFSHLGLGYLRKFFVNPLRNFLGTFVGLLELISEFAKIISLSFRLFGNLFAGQVLLFVVSFLLPFLVPLPFYGLEVFVGFMQAFVFAILTLVFSASAVAVHEGEGH